MERTLYLNCDSGMSGDLFLSTMLDLGVPREHLEERLKLLSLDGYNLVYDKVTRNGIEASSVDVILDDPEQLRTNPYSGAFRNYRQIKEIIDASALHEQEKRIAHRIFHIKSKAESVVHGVSQDEVKFHEAGAIDSVVDVVGAAVCITYFNPSRVVSNRVPTGFGTVQCACGELSVPVPAVREILSQTGLPSYRSEIPQEILTPTGAAILAGIVDEFVTDMPVKKEGSQIGHGTGTRETGLPPMEAMLH